MRDAAPVVLALPRGGVPVGYEVARALGAPLHALLVAKIGAPRQEELAVGAMLDGDPPQVLLDDGLVRRTGANPEYLEAEIGRQAQKLARRRADYGAPHPPVAGRTCIAVDDGIATGASMRAALRGLAVMRAGRRVLAVPVAPPDSLAALAACADETVCLLSPEDFGSVGEYYDDFMQTEDAEVVALLAQSRNGRC